MRKIILSLAVAVLGTAGTYAQGDSKTTTSVVTTPSAHHDCIMADEAAWTSLGLNTEQIKRVQLIQERCKKDCEAMAKEKGSHDQAAMDKHEKEIQTVLTKEQYAAWQKWCTEQRADKPMPEKK